MRPRCIVCERPAPGGFDRCECGYDFETGDTSQSRIFLRRENRAARLAQLAGAGLLASAPAFVAIIYQIGLFATLLSVLAALVELVVGGVLFVQGTSDGRLARSRLRRLDRPLPTAIVIASRHSLSITARRARTS